MVDTKRDYGNSPVSAAPVLRVGCPMWAHRPWIGRWYPASTRAGSELELYVRLCNAVEGNTTFYAEPAATTVQRWAEQSSSEFSFAFKLPRVITHDRRLQDVAEPVRSFLNRVEPLGDSVGPVQVQLPPAFGPDGADVLTRFLRRLPRDWSWALELRHPGWFDLGEAHRRLDGLLLERGIARVVLDTRPLYSAAARTGAGIEERANKPKLPVALDAVGPHPIVRVIGHDDLGITRQGLQAWSDPVIEWLDEGRTPYVFVHQPENLDSPGLARDFHAAIRRQRPNMAPLPEPVDVTEANQGSLFS